MEPNSIQPYESCSMDAYTAKAPEGYNIQTQDSMSMDAPFHQMEVYEKSFASNISPKFIYDKKYIIQTHVAS